MNLSRRIFVRNGLVTLAALGSGAMLEPGFLANAALAAESSAKPRRKVLVCVFQRGAADGLSMVAPHGDPFYYKLRQEIAVPRPRKGDTSAAIDLDGFFGLHPRLDALAPLYQRGELAVIHACGSPSNSRSHFDMQDFMESGVADDKSVSSGWANRALSERPAASKPTPFRAVAMSASIPRTLQGDLDVMAIRDLDSFGVRGSPGVVGSPTMNEGATKTKEMNGFEGLYSNAVDQTLSGAGRESFDAIALLKKANPTQYKPAKGIDYPKTSLGQSLLQVAQLIKADVGVEIAFVQDEGWDTHANQGGPYGQIGNKLLDFGRALATFNADLGDRMADVMVLSMTEFGRAVRQNGNRGTDHGHASCFFAIGGGVKGGKVYADWPTLAPEKLFEERDLAVTTDFRNVFAEVCVNHLGVKSDAIPKVLPKFKWDAARGVGFTKL
ncbi:DUF1501 domain-containing protein [Humisphaera borealis]|uniref:DUF1501 domain-containing protein n=1 Tax=Humisphaera borealis TaxID=2807512 RepID=A0A7M2WXH0_9BACT|nr:DUF1501 domain-containing protein [Humisphaera borealis]QOV90109.1 DUF1501 domain-containing protein [Humisphaera borealis]